MPEGAGRRLGHRQGQEEGQVGTTHHTPTPRAGPERATNHRWQNDGG